MLSALCSLSRPEGRHYARLCSYLPVYPTLVERNERDRTVFGKSAGEDVGAREAVEVAGNRKAEVVENGWRDVDDRCAQKIALRDMPAVRHHEAIRRALVAAAQLGIADDTLEHPLAKTQGLHAEARHDEQEIIGAK